MASVSFTSSASLTSGAAAGALPWQERLAGLRQEMVQMAQEIERLRQLAEAAEGGGPGRLNVSGAELDPERRELKAAGCATHVTVTEFELLRLLMGQPLRVFSRAEILARVFGIRDQAQGRIIDAHVNRLRRKLPLEAARCLDGVYGVGYRWKPEAQPEEMPCQ